LNDDINTALGGTGDAVINFDEDSSTASLSFSKLNNAGESMDMFTCEGTSCTATTVGLDTTYDCPTMSCGLTCEVGSDGACSAMLERVVGNVGNSGVSVTCNGESCEISERMLNMYFGDVSCGI